MSQIWTKPMKMLVLSTMGAAHDFAIKMTELGVAVTYFQKNNTNPVMRDDRIVYLDSWRDNLDDRDLVVCDSPDFSYKFRNIERGGTPLLYLDSSSSYDSLLGVMHELPIPAVDFLASVVGGDFNGIAELRQPRQSWWKRVMNRA